MLKKFCGKAKRLSSNESQNKSNGSSNSKSAVSKPTFKKLKLRKTSRDSKSAASAASFDKTDRMPTTAAEAAYPGIATTMPYQDMLRQNESFSAKKQAPEVHGIVRKSIKSKISLALNKNNSRGLQLN
jgi:hypothetical protein